jgi:hypothetical protein
MVVRKIVVYSKHRRVIGFRVLMRKLSATSLMMKTNTRGSATGSRDLPSLRHLNDKGGDTIGAARPSGARLDAS